MIEYHGVLQISSKKSLEEFKKSGQFKRMIDAGYIYSECGRFSLEQCNCNKCKKSKKLEL